MSSTARKRTRATGSGQGPGQSSGERNGDVITQAPPSSRSESPAVKAAPRATSIPGRLYLKVFCGLVSLTCFTLVALSLLSNKESAQIEFSSKPTHAAEYHDTPDSTGAGRGIKREEGKAKPSQSPPFNSALPFSLPPRLPPTKAVRAADEVKQAAVKAAFRDSWDAYVEDAFGADEYHPISQTGSNFSVNGGVGYFIIDTLDVLLIMGEEGEYERVRDWVREVDWSSRSGKFSVFETTIRTLGGLLSAHALCQPGQDTLSPHTSQLCSPDDSKMYLEKAVELAERLRPAFQETKLGIPLREVDFQTGEVFADVDNRNMSSLAEVASIQLEFKYLAHATGNIEWWTLAEKPMRAILRAARKAKSDGLLPIFISPYTGDMLISGIRLGSRGDSYYEYLIKQFIQTNHSEEIYGSMYREAVTGIKRHLLKQSEERKLLYTSEIEPRFLRGQQRPVFMTVPKQDHLVCFLGGSYMLGALYAREEQRRGRGGEEENGFHVQPYPPSSLDAWSLLAQEDWTIGHELIRTCVDTYTGTKTGLAAEITMFRMANDSYKGKEQDWYIKKSISAQRSGKKSKVNRKAEPLIDARNILRPETVESLFIAFHLTGDVIYRQWGWQIFESFVRFTKIRGDEKGRMDAFSSIRDVEAEAEEVEREDRMETFWLAETLKYLYLLFSDQETLRLDQWVLNTEAHPLPVFQPTFETSVE